MGAWSFLVAVLAALVAIVIAFFILWERDPIKSALSRLTASIIVLAGSLGSQSIEIKAYIPKNDALGFPFEVTEFVITGTPIPIWITAFLSIAGLLAWFGKLIVDDRARTNNNP